MSSDETCIDLDDSDKNNDITVNFDNLDTIEPATDDSYYGSLFNILRNTTETVLYDNSDYGEYLKIIPPETNIISGALNVIFKCKYEYGLSVPNYMKSILMSDDDITKNTFFSNMKDMISSEYFIASFDSVSESGTTDTNVPVNIKLDDTSSVYINNIYDKRTYYKKTDVYQALAEIMYMFNLLIDKVIEYDWRATENTNTNTNTYYDVDDTNCTIYPTKYIISDEDKKTAACYSVVSTFFNTSGTTSTITGVGPHHIYKQFMHTLLLPAILHHVINRYETSRISDFFYYLGYIPEGSECDMVYPTNDDETTGIVFGSVEASSAYSQCDFRDYEQTYISGSDNIDPTLWWAGSDVGYDASNTKDPVNKLTSLKESTDNDETVLKTTKDIVTFPRDDRVFEYLTYKYAADILYEIELVIKRMNYYPVLLKRFHDTCLNEESGFAKTSILYYEPIIGFPFFISTLAGEQATKTCSTNLIEDSSLNLSQMTNNVIRDVSISTDDSTSIIYKYGNSMINGDGNLSMWVLLPNILTSLNMSVNYELFGSSDTVYSPTSLLYIRMSPSQTDVLSGAYRRTVKLQYIYSDEDVDDTINSTDEYVLNSSGKLKFTSEADLNTLITPISELLEDYYKSYIVNITYNFINSDVMNNSKKTYSLAKLYDGCAKLESINFGDSFGLLGITNMSYMFNDCSSLKSVDTSKFDCSKLTNCSYMFKGCSAVESIDISSFISKNEPVVNSMFSNINTHEWELYVQSSFLYYLINNKVLSIDDDLSDELDDVITSDSKEVLDVKCEGTVIKTVSVYSSSYKASGIKNKSVNHISKYDANSQSTSKTITFSFEYDSINSVQYVSVNHGSHCTVKCLTDGASNGASDNTSNDTSDGASDNTTNTNVNNYNNTMPNKLIRCSYKQAYTSVPLFLWDVNN